MPADHLPGAPRIPGHQILRLLGEGGMGRVYLAEDTALGRKTAIKVVSASAAFGDAHARFLREARAMAAVEHRHVVRVHAFGEVEGAPYLVMEYIQGETLTDRLRREGRLPVPEALRLVRQTVEGLEAAWEHHLVHRDIKPQNLLLDQRGDVHVADFGLAKPLQADSDPTLTATGSTAGTPHYISPEQARGAVVDFRSDIYSLGIVLYEMLSGTRPFQGTTPFEIVAKHLGEPLPSLAARCPDVPPAVVALVEAMTAKDAASRPASYAALRERIDGCLSGEMPTMVPTPKPAVAAVAFAPAAAAAIAGASAAAAVQAGSSAAVAPAAPRTGRLWRRPGLGLTLASACAAVALGAAGWQVWRAAVASPAPARKAGARLVVAVTPFYGPDDESTKEGRTTAGLVESAVRQRLGQSGVRVLGLKETKDPVNSHEEALALGERLGATVVIWGEAFRLRAETKIQPYITLVRRPAPPAPSAPTERPAVPARVDPLDAMQQMSAESVMVEADARNQFALHETSAAGVGDMVIVIAGVHALYAEEDPTKALMFFEKAPRTAESLRYRAEALSAIGRRRAQSFLSSNKEDDALAALREAVALDPRDAQSQALLGDLHVRAKRWREAAAAYRAAAETGQPFSTTEGVFDEGKLCIQETPPSGLERRLWLAPAAYMLCVNPETGVVLERYRLPGVARRFTPGGAGIEISYGVGSSFGASMLGDRTFVFSHGRFDRPVFDTNEWIVRRNGERLGVALARNFLEDVNAAWQKGSPVRRFPLVAAAGKPDPTFPTDIRDLETAARRAVAQDPTQPWHLWVLGQALWSEDRPAEAEQAWATIFTGRFPATAYYEFGWMAGHFERLGQRTWADRAFQEALRRRQQNPQPIGATSDFFERLINQPVNSAAFNVPDSERRYLWLQRARQLSGVCLEGDDLAAAAWATYFERRGDEKRAADERAYLRRALRHPGNVLSATTLADYGVYAFFSASVTLFVLLGSCVRRPTGSKPLPHWLVWSVLGAECALVGLRVAGVAGPLTVLLMAPLIGAALLVPVLRTFGRTAGPARPGWAAAIRAQIAAVPGSKRRVLAAGAVAVAATAVFASSAVERVGVIMSAPIGVADSWGHAGFLRQLDDELKANDGRELRFVAAVAHHLAGDVARARELYAASGDPRARANLSALAKGVLTPPAPATSEELYQARFRTSWSGWFARVAGHEGRGMSASQWVLVTVAIGVGLLVLAFWLVPPLAEAETPPYRTRSGRRLAQVAFSLLPGVYDLRRGSAVRGYVTLLLFVLAFLAFGFRLRHPSLPVMGLLGAIGRPGLTTAFPLPWPEGASIPRNAADFYAIADFHYWAFFWAQRYVEVFCAVVILAAVLSLTLHVTRLRRIWSL